jgi:hypothetical protein
MSTAFIKISLLLQYLRIFERQSFSHHLCVGVGVFTALWGLAYSILGWVPCVPVYMFWQRTPQTTQTCFAFGSLNPDQFAGTFISHSAINMALDLVVLAIPMPLYFRTGTSRRTRLALLGLLALGGV